jgi:hypothetical protein
MEAFEPTDHFVSRVMADIHAYEASRGLDIARKESRLFSKPLRYALSASGILLGMVNVIRIASTFISPALCR